MVLAALPLVYVGCGAPAGPPAPPTEIPSPVVLKFAEPEDLRIDLTTINVVATTTSVKAVVQGDNVTQLIQRGHALVDLFETSLLAPAFDGISAIEMPVSEETTTFASTVEFVGATGFLALLDGVHEVKIDFADYDFDNDGVNEGCSGHTAALPVCARFWLDGKRYAAWVFEEYPFDEDAEKPGIQKTIGKGKFKILEIPDEVGNVGSFAYNYAESIVDPLSKDVENFIVADMSNSSVVGLANVVDFLVHSDLSQDGPEATALKNLNVNAHYDFFDPSTSATGYLDLKYLGRYIEGQDYWSGSSFAGGIQTDGNPFTGFPFPDEQNVCAQISTGLAVLLGFCDDLGISVGTTPYVRVAAPADVAVPTDFPATPTF